MNDILAKQILIGKKVDKRLLISWKLLVDQWYALDGMGSEDLVHVVLLHSVFYDCIVEKYTRIDLNWNLKKGAMSFGKTSPIWLQDIL